MKPKSIVICLIVLLTVISSSFVSADIVVSNSADWRDVYSSMMYATLSGNEGKFLTSTRHSTILLNSLPKTQPLEIVSSRQSPYVVGYESIVASRGFDNINEEVRNDINLELAEELTDVTDFVVLDDSYGYNALAVAPYAAVSNSYVLFADDDNIDDIVDFLNSRTVDSLILYGQLDRNVKSDLDVFNPEIINEGDRFDNNIEIVKKYMEVRPTKQTILTSGEFMESSMMNGKDPVLFIGTDNVPEQVANYIQTSDIEVGVLIGNELIGTATFIRRTVGISVFVKFAQGSRTPSAAIAPVEDLDRFPMPSYNLELDIFSINYNQGTKSLEVTFQNLVDLASYMKSTITVSQGDEFFTVGDDEPIFIDGGDFKTIVYDKTSAGDPLDIREGEDVSARVFTIYGESKKSLEFTIEKTLDINFVSVLDGSDIEIEDLVYDKRAKRFEVKIKNIGSREVYVNPEIIDIWINGEVLELGAEDVALLKPDASKWIRIPAELEESDIERNDEVTVRANFGERETALIKSKEATFEFKEKGIDYVTYGLILIIIIILLLLLFRRRKKKKKEHHGTHHRSSAGHHARAGHARHSTHRPSHGSHHRR